MLYFTDHRGPSSLGLDLIDVESAEE